MKKQIIRAEQLSRSYKTGDTVVNIIQKMDLSVYKDDFTVIMGNSGSGKSTLLYLLSGLDKVSTGKVWLDEQPLHLCTEKKLAILRRHKVGFVFQDSSLVPNLSVRENILVAGRLVSDDRRLLNEKSNNLLDELGILPLADRMPSQLSGGEKQRCAIARALINDPAVLFADEPTGNLNSEAAAKVLTCLHRLHKKGQSIIMVTHDLKSAGYGNRIIFLRDGTIVDELTSQGQTYGKEETLAAWLNKNDW